MDIEGATCEEKDEDAILNVADHRPLLSCGRKSHNP